MLAVLEFSDHSHRDVMSHRNAQFPTVVATFHLSLQSNIGIVY
jgi:hypothetical protein